MKSSGFEGPYQNQGVSGVYNMLFCDNAELYRQKAIEGLYPWDILLSATFDPEKLQEIINNPHTETRPKILAYNKLALNGKKSTKKDLLGIIVEVAMDEGLDTLAAYKDGTARYINHSQKLIIWDVPNDESRQITDQLFKDGENVVKKISPWEEPRLKRPPPGDVRITLLVTDGLYFGQAQSSIMFNEPMGGPVMAAATQLMKYLTEKTYV